MFSRKGRGKEDTPLLSETKNGQAETFFSGSWLLVVCTATVGLSLAGSILHSTVAREQEVLRLTAALGKSVFPNSNHSASTFVNAASFQKCNAAMSPVELSGMQGDSIISSNECGWAEAISIAGALRGAGYDFEAITPRPYIYPAYLQQALVTLKADLELQAFDAQSEAEFDSQQELGMLKAQRLAVALKHLQEHAPGGKLGTLVKFFAWGLPVASSDLEAALSPSALTALLRCQLLAPCSQLPGMTTSTAMFFPVPNTTLLVTTDWASRSTIGMNEKVVPIVSPETMALIYNSPSPKGLSVLDLDSGAGVQGLVAAERGAASVTLFFTNLRAMRFAHFSSLLNDLGGAVSLLQANSGEQAFLDGLLGAEFGLLLAQPPFLPVPSQEIAARFPQNGGPNGTQLQAETLKLAQKVLAPGGLLALVSEFGIPKLLPPLCSKLGLPGFRGNLILQQRPVSLEAFATARSGLGAASKQVDNMKAQGVTGVVPGFLFARRGSRGLASSDDCGSLAVAPIEDPLAWPTPGEPKFMRPCSHSHETDCPDIVYKVLHQLGNPLGL